jgi:hypothetical protein
MDFILYLHAIVANWLGGFWWLTGLPEAASYLVPPTWFVDVQAMLDKRIDAERRRKVYVFIAIAGIFLASFYAWDEQYQVAMSKSSEALTAQITSLRDEIGPLKTYKELHEAAEWPALTQEQQKKWVAALARYAGKLQTLDIVVGDSRSEAFTDSLKSTFKAAGLPDAGVFPGNTPDGLGVYGNRPDIVKTFADLFGQWGFPVKSHSDSPLNPQPSQVQIIIGRKVAP